MIKLEVKDVSKYFSEKLVLHHLNLHVLDHEIISIIGPSGVGKSTLFNIIAGLLTPSSGEVLLDGESVIDMPGKVSYMLQKDLLLPYKTIEENITLPLILQGVKKKEALQRANQLLEEFNMASVSKSYPKDLSGGMRQRIALLRTYLFSSNLILLDEPFSALDSFTKSEIHEWYLNIHKKLSLTTLFITHDIDEAIKLSDRIYILKNQSDDQLDMIELSKEKNADFQLTKEFLDYKKQVIENLNTKFEP
ncbi:ABC transporter ATP-binding protein [Enterococcus thailandicus]|uniref:ABC transporter ATP-binding protein n=1 Tax=Enterococcus TaxID=1350 RepID=UPI0022E66CA5|nr:ABC transporter ATP-binding protein [Enterococcus thailandicus]